MGDQLSVGGGGSVRLFLPGYPIRSRERHLGHGGRLDGECDEILRLQIVHVALAVGARDGLAFERQHGQIVGEPLSRSDRIEPLRQLGVLRRDANGIAPLVQSS